MGYPLTLARRYLTSKKRNMISISTALAIGGVTLGVAALAIVMSVTAGFQEQFRDKVLGVNAHVIILKDANGYRESAFREYREVMDQVKSLPGVAGAGPFVITPTMMTHGSRTATGVLLKGVDPVLMQQVLDLPKHIVEGDKDLKGLRRPDAKPPETPIEPTPLRREPEYEPLPDLPDGALDRKIDEAVDKLREAGAADARASATADPLDAGAGRSPAAPRDAGVHLRDAEATATAPPPEGPITPDGGYTSELPEDDVIPKEVFSDPCDSTDLVHGLPGVIIGVSLAKQLGLGIDDCVQVTSPTIGFAFGARSRPPIAKQFRVIAMFEAGFDQYDSKLIYTDLYEAQTLYEGTDTVTGVELRVFDIDKAEQIARDIDEVLPKNTYKTTDWNELNHGLFTALLIQQIAMSVVLALIIVVAAFTVIATLIMVVLDKKKEIALLKAIGAKDGDVLRVFLYQGGIIGVAGTTAGLILGFICCRFLLAYGFPLDPKVYFISKLPVSMNPSEFIITGVFAILTCLAGTIFPALYAANLRPSDGLRAE